MLRTAGNGTPKRHPLRAGLVLGLVCGLAVALAQPGVGQGAMDQGGVDYGDAPDSYGTALGQNGARHNVGGPFMGGPPDAEANGQPNLGATGDDQAGTDDEDGVMLPDSLIPGMTAVAQVDVRNSPRGCFLNAWVDFNADGDFTDADEQIFDDRFVASKVFVENIVFGVPLNAKTGPSYARFRCSSSAGLGPTGPAPDGEVEDLTVAISPQACQVLDGFNQSTELDPSAGVFYVDGISPGPRNVADNGAPEVQGGIRNVGLGPFMGNPEGFPGYIVASYISAGQLFLISNADSRAPLHLHYDAGGAGLNLDLTGGVLENLRLDYRFDDAGIGTDSQVRMTMSDGVSSATVARNVMRSPTPFSIAFPFAEFTAQAPIDLSNIQRIDVDFDTHSAQDFNLDAFSACGPTLGLGDTVFKDLDNDGLYEPADGEFGIEGVRVDLHRDMDGSGDYTPGIDPLHFFTTTGADGGYFFRLLEPGDYIVRVDAAAFQPGGPLEGMPSSTGNDDAMLMAPDPDTDIENDDNGFSDGQGGVVTKAITLVPQMEPAGIDGDPNTNLTVDLGFYNPPPAILCLGDTIFKDLDNDGLWEPGQGEQPIVLVRLNLYEDTDGSGDLSPADTYLDSTTSDGNGEYEFCELIPGEYIVQVDPVNFEAGERLYKMPTSTGNDAMPGMAPDPDDDVDNDDNGALDYQDGVSSKAITLAVATEPGPFQDGDDANGNQTLDFGFWCPHCIGDLVFKDLDDDGLLDRGDGEAGIQGVKLNLYEDSDGSGELSDGDLLLGMTFTDDEGNYEFCDLPDGDYIVEIDAANFLPGGPLVGHVTSLGNELNGMAPDPDDDVDHDDNGYMLLNGRVASKAITLGCGTEPPKREDGDDENGNLTLDFGFACPPPASLCLGDLVFLDLDDDGLYEPADGETGINLVRVNLWEDTDGSGDLSAGDTELGTRTTDGQGRFSFCGLDRGTYILEVDPQNFQPGWRLHDKESSMGNDLPDGTAPDPDDNVDDDDNGYRVLGFGVATKAVTLAGGTEPPAAVDGDDSDGNLTVDLGFKCPLCVGDTVFKDVDNDGFYEPGDGEFGIDNVVMNLYRDSDLSGDLTPADEFLDTTVTSNEGKYIFCDLINGEYIVEVDPSNFEQGGPLQDAVSSSGNDINGMAPDPDDDVDNDDNGTPVPGRGVASKAVTLSCGMEPPKPDDTDGIDSNLTVDFGFEDADIPMGLFLGGFRAKRMLSGDVALTWWTVQEQGLSAFQLERGPSPEGPWTLASPWVAAQGGGAGASYSEMDPEPGQAGLYYRLRILQDAGSLLHFGPVAVRPGYVSVYLPALSQPPAR